MRNRSSDPASSIDISEAAGVRFLHFGSDWVQGAMRIARPNALELEYTREMMLSLLLREADNFPRNALLVGLGAGSLAKFLYRHRPDCRITVIEINPQVEYVARQFFKLPDDPRRLRILIEDGAEFMLRGSDTYDAIFVDGFDADGEAGVLDTEPFYLACRARLSTLGLLTVNLLGKDRSFPESVARLRQAFDNRVMLLPPSSSGNVIGFARGDESVLTNLASLRANMENLQADTGLNLLPTLSRLQLLHPTPEGQLAF